MAIIFLALLALASARSPPRFSFTFPQPQPFKFKGPVDCKVKYTDWTPCSVPCGPGGFQQRWGEITEQAKNGGRPCPALEQQRACLDNPECAPPAPIDCQVWYGEWSQCTKLCGGGTQWRRAVVEVEPKNGGKQCPELTQEQACNQNECDVPKKDCEVWFAEWSQCSASCNGGFQWRKGVVEVRPQNGGKPCPKLEQEQPCNQFECDVPDRDCKVSYAAWSQCSKPCGGGFQWRRGTIIEQQQGNGKPCPQPEQLEEEQACNQHSCTTAPINCKVQYSEWTPCSQPCGGGFSRRWAKVLVRPDNGGAPCPRLEEERSCNEQLCDVAVVDCKVTFTPWTECSAPCGGGSQERWGRVDRQPSNGGIPCPELEQKRSCNEQPCLVPVDCKLWFPEWSSCSKSCGGGFKQRRGLIEIAPENGGKPCPAFRQELPCNQFECDVPKVDCKIQYARWSECTQPCGGGTQWRRATIIQEAVGAGVQCPSREQLSEERACNTFACTPDQPIDCKVTFSQWSRCSKPCGGGLQARWARVDQEPSNGGKPCPELEQQRSCNEQLCDVPVIDCKVQYSAFSACSAKCGGGVKRRFAKVLQSPQNGGAPCPALVEEVPCNENINCVPGVVDCIVRYTDWTPCSKLCGGGTRERWGQMTQRPTPGGAPCGPLEQSEACNTQPCAPKFFFSKF